jgi:uncharacterized phage protein (TIGR02218 family)
VANYSTYFDEYTVGVQPSDWSERWNLVNSDWTAEASDGTGATKDARLQNTATSDGRRLLSWDAVDADSNRDDVEVLARVRSTSKLNNQNWLALRAAGAAGSELETGYIAQLGSGARLEIGRYVSGSFSSLETFLFTWAPNTWYWVRFRANGTSLKAKVWEGDHSPEPAGWDIEVTDASISAAGWVGVGNFESTGIRSYDAIAVGTNGATAAFPGTPESRMTQAALLVLAESTADVRMTQAALLVLAQDAPAGPDVRMTQAALLVLAQDAPADPDVRMTQAALLVLAESTADVRMTQAALLVLADQVPCLTRWAQTWTITRTDGTVQGFTSLDRDLTFRGVVHLSCAGMSATAVEVSGIVGGQGSQELRGILSAAGVSETDLYHGLYDGAVLESWLVPWDNAGGETPVPLIRGVLGQDRHDVNELSIEILTDSAKLQQSALLEIFTPTCRYGFGTQNDARCPADLTALTVSGTVTATAVPVSPNNAARRIFTDSARGEADRHFDLGQITWTSGANAGARSEVKSFTAGQFVLWDATLNPIALSDGYDATPGCNKSTADHLRFNADLVDFGGFPHVPGIDSISDTPDSKG